MENIDLPRNWQILKDIVGFALWHHTMEQTLYEDVDWKGIYAQAQSQTIQGLLLDGINEAMNTYPWWSNDPVVFNKPGDDAVMLWTGEEIGIQRKNLLLDEGLDKVVRKLNDAEVKFAIMKGPVCGWRWPEPLHRTSGDVDVAVASEDYEKAAEVFVTMGAEHREGAEFKHIEYSLEKVPWELHFSLHRFGQRKLQRLLDYWVEKELQSPRMMSIRYGEDQDVLIPVFRPELELTHLLLHFIQHAIHEGCGMRQLIDFAMVLQDDLPKCDEQLLLQHIHDLQLTRSLHVVMYLCENVLGMPECKLHFKYTSLEIHLAGKVEERMMTDGNFGHSTGWKKPKGLWGSVCYNLRSLRREITFIPLWPRETLLFPLEVLSRKI